MSINDLPEEILIKIFSNLTHLELFCVVRKVCALWSGVCLSNPLWKAIDVDEELANIQRKTKNDNEAILAKILLEVHASIRDFRFNASLIPLVLQNNDDSLRLHNVVGQYVFKTFDTNNTFVETRPFPSTESREDCRLINDTASLAIGESDDDTGEDCKTIKYDKNDCDLGSDGTFRNDQIQKDIGGTSETKHKQQCLKREFDVIEIRETTGTLSIVELNNFLSNLGEVKVLRIYTTKNLTNILVESLANLVKIDELELHMRFYDPDDETNSNQREHDNTHNFEIICYHAFLQYLFENLQNMTKLITDVMHNDALLTLVRNNRKLRHLSIRNCTDITKDGFVEMPVLDNLLHLDISSTFVGDKCLAIIGKNMPNLQEFLFENCIYVTDIGLSYIGQHCSNLHTLVIDKEENSGSRNITNVGLEYIAEGCKELRVLVAKYCQGINDIGLQALVSNCSKLSVLKIAGCSGITDIGIDAISKCCKHLRRLNMKRCVKVTHKGMNSLIGNCLWLEELKADGCTFIKDLMINSDTFCTGMSEPNDTRKHSHVRKLSFGFCSNITDPNDTRKHSHVRKLSFGFCSNITDHSVKEIANFCPDIRELYLTGTFLVTDAAIEHLLQKCKALKVLDISRVPMLGLSEFTNEVLNSVRIHGKHVEKLMLLRNYKISKAGVSNLLIGNENIKELHITACTKENTDDSGVSVLDCQQICEALCESGEKATMKYYNTQYAKTQKRFADIIIHCRESNNLLFE